MYAYVCDMMAGLTEVLAILNNPGLSPGELVHRIWDHSYNNINMYTRYTVVMAQMITGSCKICTVLTCMYLYVHTCMHGKYTHTLR